MLKLHQVTLMFNVWHCKHLNLWKKSFSTDSHIPSKISGHNKVQYFLLGSKKGCIAKQHFISLGTPHSHIKQVRQLIGKPHNGPSTSAALARLPFLPPLQPALQPTSTTAPAGFTLNQCHVYRHWWMFCSEGLIAEQSHTVHFQSHSTAHHSNHRIILTL